MRCLLQLIIVIVSFNLLILLFTTYNYVERPKMPSTFLDTLDKYKKYHASHKYNYDNKSVLIYHPLMAGGLNNRLISIITTLTIALLQWKVYYTKRSKNDHAYIMYGEHSTFKVDYVLKSPFKEIIVETQFCWAEYVVKYYNNSKRFLELGLVDRIGNNRMMGNQIAHLFYTKMFLLKPQYQYQINKIKERIKGKYIIGMHMRSGFGDFPDTERFLVPGQEYTFIEKAKKLSKEHSNVVWYFTSDSSYLDTIVQQEANPYEVIVFETDEIIHTRSGTNIQSDINAITDMSILGNANELILTSRSTFSLASFFISNLSLLENFENVNWINKTHILNTNFNEMKDRYEKLMNVHINYINDCLKSSKTFCKDTDFNEYETGINLNPVLPVYANSQNYTKLILFSPDIGNCSIIIVILTEPYDFVFRTTYRKTYANMKTMNNKIVSYMFVVGVPFKDKKGDAYPIEFLNSELKENSDIFVWNITHVGETKTTRLRLLYEYLLSHYSNLEHVIQIHSNILFSSNNIIKFMNNKDCDVTGDKGFLGIEYIGGAFHLLSKRYLKLVVQHVPFNVDVLTTFDLYFIRTLTPFGVRLCKLKKNVEYIRYNGKFNDFLEGKFTVLEAVPPATFLLVYNRTQSLLF